MFCRILSLDLFCQQRNMKKNVMYSAYSKINKTESLILKESDSICIINLLGSQLASWSVLNVRLALSSGLATPWQMYLKLYCKKNYDVFSMIASMKHRSLDRWDERWQKTRQKSIKKMVLFSTIIVIYVSLYLLKRELKGLQEVIWLMCLLQSILSNIIPGRGGDFFSFFFFLFLCHFLLNNPINESTTLGKSIPYHSTC